MSAFLTIAGFTIEVVESGANELPPTVKGKSERSFSNKLRSTIDPDEEARNWEFTALELSSEDEAVLKTAVPNGAYEQCGGDALVARSSSATLLCEVTYKNAPYIIDNVLGFKKALTIALTEV